MHGHTHTFFLLCRHQILSKSLIVVRSADLKKSETLGSYIPCPWTLSFLSSIYPVNATAAHTVLDRIYPNFSLIPSQQSQYDQVV